MYIYRGYFFSFLHHRGVFVVEVQEVLYVYSFTSSLRPLLTSLGISSFTEFCTKSLGLYGLLFTGHKMNLCHQVCIQIHGTAAQEVYWTKQIVFVCLSLRNTRALHLLWLREGQ